MTMQGAQFGIAQWMVYKFTATAGQTVFSGLDDRRFVLNYVAPFLWVIRNGRLLPAEDYTASDGSTLALATSCSVGEEIQLYSLPPFNLANVYTQAQSDASIRRFNRIVDPGMRLSQEQGNNSLALPSNGTALYPSDSFLSGRVSSAGGASVQRVAQLTPGGSPFRIRFTVTAVNANPAAGDYAQIGTKIEGFDLADLKLGTASARPIVLRFGCNSSVAGTFPVYFRNGTYSRGWIGSVTIAPAEVGLDVIKSVVIPATAVGAWPTDNTLGADLGICLSAGTSNQGVPGWQAGSYVGLPTGLNLMAVNGATFDLFDVGLYDATGLAQGTLPPFQLDPIELDSAKCYRYYEKGGYSSVSYASAANQYTTGQIAMVRKRISPTMTGTVDFSSAYLANSFSISALTSAQARALALSSGAGQFEVTGSWTANARL